MISDQELADAIRGKFGTGAHMMRSLDLGVAVAGFLKQHPRWEPTPGARVRSPHVDFDGIILAIHEDWAWIAWQICDDRGFPLPGRKVNEPPWPVAHVNELSPRAEQ